MLLTWEDVLARHWLRSAWAQFRHNQALRTAPKNRPVAALCAATRWITPRVGSAVCAAGLGLAQKPTGLNPPERRERQGLLAIIGIWLWTKIVTR